MSLFKVLKMLKISFEKLFVLARRCVIFLEMLCDYLFDLFTFLERLNYGLSLIHLIMFIHIFFNVHYVSCLHICTNKF